MTVDTRHDAGMFTHRRRKVAHGLVLAFACVNIMSLAVACGSNVKTSPSTRQACLKTQLLLDDLDTLDNVEIRGRIKAINDSAEASEITVIREGARALLVAATQDSDPLPPMKRLIAGCQSVG